MSGRSSFLGKSNSPRTYYNKEDRRWYLFTNIALSKQQIEACVNYTKTVLKKHITNSNQVSRIKLTEMYNLLTADSIIPYIVPNELDESYLIKNK